MQSHSQSRASKDQCGRLHGCDDLLQLQLGKKQCCLPVDACRAWYVLRYERLREGRIDLLKHVTNYLVVQSGENAEERTYKDKERSRESRVESAMRGRGRVRLLLSPKYEYLTPLPSTNHIHSGTNTGKAKFNSMRMNLPRMHTRYCYGTYARTV